MAKPVLPKISPSVLANARNAPTPKIVSPAPSRGTSPRTGPQRTKPELTRTNLSHQTSDRPSPNIKTPSTVIPRAPVPRTRNDAVYRTPTSGNTRTLVEKRSQNMSMTGASPTVAASNRTASPVRVPVNIGKTGAYSQNTSEKTPASYGSCLTTDETDQSFFYADAALSQPRSQRPTLVSKTSSFVYANGEEEEPERPKSPIVQRPERPTSPIVLGSPFKDRRDGLSNSQTSAIPLEDLSLIHISEPTRPY